ncbi:hypothetical protein ACIF9R_25965 [Streptomyces sp. NPDC086080]|uniref:hypothetical protein n=1 Tax=Streptomyces sp. NPDC086080 TaxID=3365748 RepID=UPI0037CE0587
MIFGTPDSGVAASGCGDGATLLDEIWSGAPFGDKNALVTRVRFTVDARVDGGLPSGADGDGVVSTARQPSGPAATVRKFFPER